MSPIKKIKKLVIRLLESRGYCVSFGEPATLAGILSAFDKRGGDFFFVHSIAQDVPYLLLHAAAVFPGAALKACLYRILYVPYDELAHDHDLQSRDDIMIS